MLRIRLFLSDSTFVEALKRGVRLETIHYLGEVSLCCKVLQGDLDLLNAAYPCFLAHLGPQHAQVLLCVQVRRIQVLHLSKDLPDLLADVLARSLSLLVIGDFLTELGKGVVGNEPAVDLLDAFRRQLLTVDELSKLV